MIEFYKPQIGGTVTVAKVYPSGKVTFQDRLPSGLGVRSAQTMDYWTGAIRATMDKTGESADVVAIRALTGIGFHVKS